MFHKRSSPGIDRFGAGLEDIGKRESEDLDQQPSSVGDWSGREKDDMMVPVAVLNSFAPLMLKQTLEHNLVAIFTLARYEDRDGVSA